MGEVNFCKSIQFKSYCSLIQPYYLHKKKKYEAELNMNLMKGFLMAFEKEAQGQMM